MFSGTHTVPGLMQGRPVASEDDASAEHLSHADCAGRDVTGETTVAGMKVEQLAFHQKQSANRAQEQLSY